MNVHARTLAAALIASGCGDGEQNSVIETEYLSISVDPDTPLCRGSLLDYDQDFERISTLTGLPPNGRLEVAYGQPFVDAMCPDGSGGCVSNFGAETWVAADDTESLVHELVHASRRQHFLLGPRSIEEGLANVLRAREGLPSRFTFQSTLYGGPAQLWPLQPDAFYAVDSSYVSSGSIIRWMVQAYGQETVMDFVNDDALLRDAEFDEVLSALDRHLGVSLEALDTRWTDEVDLVYNLGDPCTAATTFDLDEVMAFSDRHDCDNAEDTIDARDIGDGWQSQSRVRCIRVTEPRVLRMSLDALGGTAIMAPASHDCEPPTWHKEVAAPGEPVEFEAAPCTWRLWFAAPVETVTDWQVELIAL